MRTFRCVCGRRLFFENTTCVGCGRELVFDPDRLQLVALAPGGSGELLSEQPPRRRLRHCANRMSHGACNWGVAADDPGRLCVSCALTEVTPSLEQPESLRRWRVIEEAKRRLVFTLLDLGLSLEGLRFAFLEDRSVNPLVTEEQVVTGHEAGLVTINIAEADDAERERVREAMGEPYRTLLGHLRHESGHYYWHGLVEDGSALAEFRGLFGDERAEYAASLAAYYDRPDRGGWQDRYVSEYARSHPFEDWAESWAHYLHMVDTLETASDFGIAEFRMSGDIDRWLAEWIELTVAMNALNRSMGLRDPYPFVLTEPVMAKLRFIHRAIASSPRTRGPWAARGTSP